MLDSNLDLAVAFQFKVVFGSKTGAFDTSFQEVSGMETTMKKSVYKEGGENRFEHTLPEAKQHSNLVLSRGLTKLGSPLVRWCKTVLEGDFTTPIEPMQIMVFLLNSKSLPRAAWSFDNAFPVAWKLGQFNATKNEVALETIELSYNTVERML